jgi:hypothetical protein
MCLQQTRTAAAAAFKCSDSESTEFISKLWVRGTACQSCLTRKFVSQTASSKCTDCTWLCASLRQTLWPHARTRLRMPCHAFFTRSVTEDLEIPNSFPRLVFSFTAYADDEPVHCVPRHANVHAHTHARVHAHLQHLDVYMRRKGWGGAVSMRHTFPQLRALKSVHSDIR